jgi:hypothetical protein
MDKVSLRKEHKVDVIDNWTRTFTCTCGQWFTYQSRLESHIRRGNC